MLAIIMLILKFLRCRLNSRIDLFCTGCHLGYLFQNDCIVYCFVSVLSPGEWSMVLAQDCRNSFVITIFEYIYDQKDGIFLVLIKFMSGQTYCTRDLTVHIICMGGSVAWNGSSCLRPTGSPWRMSMYHTANLWECLIQFQMGGSI